MFLVPYILLPKSPTLHCIWLFLERNGTHLIEVAGSISEFLEANELVAAAPPRTVGDITFVEISPNSDLASFYTWKETPPGTTPSREVWRAFLWAFSDTDEDPWGVNRQMETITLSQSYTAYSVLKTLRLGS